MSNETYSPSPTLLADARVSRRLGDYHEGVFRIVSITYNTVIFQYAGHEIRYKVITNYIRRKPKKPKGLDSEDIKFLDNTAKEILYACRVGQQYVNAIRRQEADLKRSIKTHLKFLKEASKPQLSLGFTSDTDRSTE